MNALILMTRIPIPGKTKTRLMETMTGNECAELHMAFLMDLFDTFNELKDKLDIYITYTPDNSLNIIEDIIPKYIKTFPQEGQDLGDKMYNAIDNVLSMGYDNVILIGSDIPDISSRDINIAFEILKEKDIVLGPSYDGGYYLVGMKEPDNGIFHISKKWGGLSVLESTIDIANSEGLSIGLAPKYRDIDTKEDLFEFMKTYENESNARALNTIKFIKEWRKNRWSKTN